MTAIAQTPITASRLKKRLENEPRVFVPATIEEYWKLVETPQLRLDYFNHQIVATMQYKSRFSLILSEKRLFFSPIKNLHLESNKKLHLLPIFHQNQ